MTNLKKVLVFVVVFAMMLTLSVSVSALSFSDVDQSASYAESVSVLSSLALMIGDDKGNFNPDKAITRAEAATIIVRAKGLEDAAAGAKGATQFTDVATDHWASGYINLGFQNGIIAGYGDGTFGPENDVTYEQITKMIVAALGYTPMADRQGGYPTGYLVIASQKGIAKGTSGQAGEAAPRATVARLLYNALTVNMMEQTVYSAGSEEYGEVEKTLLNNYLNIDVFEGIITAVPATAATVTLDDTTINFVISKANGVLATSSKYDFDDADSGVYAGETDAANYLGYYVVAYAGYDDNDDYTLFAVTPKSNKNNSLVVDYTQLEDFYVKSGDTIVEYLAKTTDRSNTKLYLSDVASYYYNGRLESASEEAQDFLAQSPVTPGSVKFVDYDNDDEYDFVFVTAYGDNYVVNEVHANQQRLVDKNGSNINIDLDDEDVIYSFYNADGTSASFDDIKVNDVLTFAESADGYLISVYISNATVEGIVSESRSDDSEDYYTVDGTEYRTTSEVSVKVGDEGIFFLNVDNRIVRKEAISTSIGNYAFLYAADIINSFDNLVQIKYVTAEGETKISDIAKKITIYKEVAGYYDAVSITDSTVTGDYGIYEIAAGVIEAKQVLFKYNTNASGVITKIYLSTTNKNINDAFTQERKGDFTYSSNNVRLGSTFLSKDTKVFNVKRDGANVVKDVNDITVSTVVSTFKDANEYYGVEIYDTVDTYPTVVVAYNPTADIDDSTKLFVITKITTSKNANDTQVDRYYGYQEGQAVNAFESEDGNTITDRDGVSTTVEAGDVVIFSLDSAGDIDKMQVLMTAAEALEVKNAADSVEAAGSLFPGDIDSVDPENFFGYAYKTESGSRLTVAYLNGSSDIVKFSGNYNVYNVNLNRTTPTVSVSSYSKISAGVYKENKDADYIFVRMYDGAVVDAVVYTFTTPYEIIAD